MSRPALDPELEIITSLLPPPAQLHPSTFVETVRNARAILERPAMPIVAGISTKDIEVETPQGMLGLRIISPDAPRADRPCIYWIHGGGYFLGSAFESDARLMTWVEALDCVIVSVDYRLAPEHPYPTPLEDCYAGLEWTATNADALGVSLDRLAIGGISAGGGLCAALAILARDRGEISPCFQLLIYPMIDDRGITASSKYSDSPIWYAQINSLAWAAYLGTDTRSPDLPITAAPARARASELAGLPPAYINVGTVDIFCDEDIAYATALIAAGVPTELHVYPGGFHGSDALAPTARISKSFNQDMITALDRALNPINE